MPNQPKPRAPGEKRPSKRDPRRKGGGSARNQNSLANLRQPWQPGQSGNASGKSATINEVMRFARAHCVEAVERLIVIMRDQKTKPRDVIFACQAIMDRGLGRPIVPVFKGSPNGFPSEMVSEVGADGAMTALLQAAGQNASDEYKATLQSELDRINREETLAKEARREAVDRAAARLANGEDVAPSMAMLAKVRQEMH